MEAVVVILLVVVAVVIAAFAFSAWVVIAVGRGLTRGVTRIVAPKRRVHLPPAMPGSVQVCSNTQCRCTNPSHARFCRRCGKSLPSLLRVVSSRVAVL